MRNKASRQEFYSCGLRLGIIILTMSACKPTKVPAVPDAQSEGTKGEASAEAEMSDSTASSSGSDAEESESSGAETGTESSQTDIGLGTTSGSKTVPLPQTESKPGATKEAPSTTSTPAKTLPDTSKDPASTTPALVVANGKYTLKSAHSGRCLDVPGANVESGLGLEIYDCANPPSNMQIFELKHLGNNFYQIMNSFTQKSLEIRGQAMQSAALIQQAIFTGADYQQFEFKPQTDGTFVIMVKGANFAVDVQGAKQENKTPIQIWPPNNYLNERWILSPVK